MPKQDRIIDVMAANTPEYPRRHHTRRLASVSRLKMEPARRNLINYAEVGFRSIATNPGNVVSSCQKRKEYRRDQKGERWLEEIPPPSAPLLSTEPDMTSGTLSDTNYTPPPCPTGAARATDTNNDDLVLKTWWVFPFAILGGLIWVLIAVLLTRLI
ncbi:hypothetical protein J4E08_02450 [Sagittula sp. NFXS13]|uniref:hypothetical protein n=1 Tax=Sagittula sp. NFXS13 TaxID=2819095 RepID=UPI0032DEB125